MTAPLTVRRSWVPPSRRTVLGAILVVGALWGAVSVGLGDLNRRGIDALADILGAALDPNLSGDTLRTVAGDTITTVAYAAASMTVALAIGLPSALLGSGVLLRRRWARLPTVVVVRGALAGARSIHELVWALLFVRAFGLEPWAGVLAVGLPYGGIVGRIVADQLQDAPAAPLDALRSSGASELQVLMFGRIPAVAPDVLGYLLYRFECAIRASVVLSFVGLGGLGFRIEIVLRDLDYETAWTAIYALILLVAAVNLVGTSLRRRWVGW